MSELAAPFPKDHSQSTIDEDPPEEDASLKVTGKGGHPVEDPTTEKSGLAKTALTRTAVIRRQVPMRCIQG